MFLVAVLSVLFVMLAVLLLYFCLAPEQYGFFPKCPFYCITGLYCPGCGFQRALHRLLHGEFLTALRCNALALAAIPYLLLGIALKAIPRPSPFLASLREALYGGKAVYVVLGIVIAFWVLRNIFPCLAPAV